MDKESHMSEQESQYKQVSLEQLITATQGEDQEKWQGQMARFQMAGALAVGLLLLFGLTIACNGTVITVLIITSTIADKTTSDSTAGIGLMIEFAKMILPYIATPLGVALGYFFRDTRRE